MSKKNILITGSSGYIGQHLVKLLRDEYTVYGCDITPVINDYLKYRHYSYRDIRHEIGGYIGLDNYPAEFDCIIHLAALVRVGESVLQPYNYYMTNLLGTINVLNGFKYRNFIYASTGSAVNPTNPYALSKLAGEDCVREACKETNYTIFRFYNVIGTCGIQPTNPDGLHSALIRAEYSGVFNLYGSDYSTPDGSAIRDYVHVKEICYAIQRAIEEPANSTEHLGHGRGYSVLEIAKKYQEVNRCSFNIVNCPRREGDLERSVLDNVSKYMTELYTFDELLKKPN